MTQRLYFEDSYLCQFSAQLIEQSHDPGGWTAVLDRTAFYPTSGGQPHDLGKIGGLDVWNVAEGEHGEVLHRLSQPLAEQEKIHCAIDWVRRFDHMQQHSGQHVLSQAFIQTSGFQTVSFHMGSDYATIDLATETLSPSQLHQAEELANIIVYENRPIRVRMVSPDEVPKLKLRKESQREGALRIVEIQEFDLSACGGTHVRRTGEIGGIFVRKLERVNRQARVTFVCGRRGVEAWRTDLEFGEEVARKFSIGLPELPQRIEKEMAEARRLRKSLKEKNKLLANLLAKELFKEAQPQREFRIVKRVFDNEDFDFIKLLAQSLVAYGPCVALLANSSEPAQLVFAVSESLDLDLRPLMTDCCRGLEGKGGGTRTFVQGGCRNSPRLQSTLDWVESQLKSDAPPPLVSGPD